MITLIILIVLIIIGIFLIKRDISSSLSFALTLILAIYLLVHIPAWGLRGYNYNLFAEKRNAFEQTLEAARENGNQYEAAAITKEVAQWNVELAVYKYQNKTILFDQYIDDRMELLEPIK